MKAILAVVLFASLPSAARAADLPDFGIKAESMPRILAESKARLLFALGGVTARPAENRTFDNTVAAVENAFSDYAAVMGPITFLSQVSPDPAVRDRSLEIEKISDQLLIDLKGREDVFRAVKEYAAKGETLTGEDQRLLADMLLEFRRNGLDLPADKQNELKALKKRLSGLELDLGNNIKEDQAALDTAKEGLEGVPADFLAELASVGEGKFSVPLDYPHYTVLMETAKRPETRREAEFRFNNKAADKNLPLLREALKARRDMAVMLGYPSYAAYELDYRRTAKTPQRVNDFLGRLQKLLAKPSKSDLAALLALKRLDDPKADKVENWDVTGLVGQQLGYYPKKYMQSKYGLDSDEVRYYFPVDRVVSETLKLYQEMLGLEFKEVQLATWHPEVKLYEIRDAATMRLMAHFYLDLYPREGKYNHMAAFDIVLARALPNGGYRLPVSAMVGNFTKPTGDKPALMSHDEVETFFHEFGHIVHQTLTIAKYSRFSGSNTALDFVESVSQMMENFVWTPQVLDRLSGHYKDPAKKLPKKLLKKMLAARNALSGLSYLRLVTLSSLDMACHDEKVPEDTTAILNKVFTDRGYLTPTPGTHFEARFGHIMSEYAAGYYGYLWSLVYAQDMFSRFEKDGLLNPAVGLDFRRKILERGSSVDEDVSMREFLGREPSEASFMKRLGIQ